MRQWKRKMKVVKPENGMPNNVQIKEKKDLGNGWIEVTYVEILPEEETPIEGGN